MKNETKTGLVVAVSLAALAISGGAVFIGSGVYDIGADDHHTKLTLAVIEQLRDRSIEARTRRVEVHTVSDPARIAAGAQRYAALCVTCHLAPGVTKSDLRPGLYPHPPNLAQEEKQAETKPTAKTWYSSTTAFGLLRWSAPSARAGIICRG